MSLRYTKGDKIPLPFKGRNRVGMGLFSNEGRQHRPVQEITVGLSGGLCFSKGYMLPEIEIEARSIDGNIKACESICQTLMEKSKEIFRLRHHSVHLSVEVI
jgi:hypothetical protein